MTTFVAALGIAAILEGLALALAPSRVESLLEALRAAPEQKVRQIGVAMAAVGLCLVWIATS